MRKGLVLLLFLSGCAGWQTKMSTDDFSGSEKEPFVTEIAIGDHNADSVTKRLTVYNPLRVPIRAYVECTAAYQDDLVVDVAARKVRFLWIGAFNYQMHTTTCRLTKYSKL